MNADVKLLEQGRRTLRTLPHSVLLGPTGARLWADCLDVKPGFSGTLDFIHKVNIPLLFSISCDSVDSFEPASFKWYPSYLNMRFSNGSIEFSENKFIAWNDCAVSCMHWKNKSKHKVKLKLELPDYMSPYNDKGTFEGAIHSQEHNYDIKVVVSAEEVWKSREIILKPGEKCKFKIAAALSVYGADSTAALQDKANSYASDSSENYETLSRQVEEYDEWFNQAPVFHSSDPIINKTWAYRWFILRHNLACPGIGNLKHIFFYEGRSHKMGKEPFNPTGWEFSKMIPLSSPLQIMDVRWHARGKEISSGMLKNLIAGQDKDGLYHCMFVDNSLASYANFIGWACYQLFLVTRDKTILEYVLPSLKKQVKGWGKVFGNSEDHLLTDTVHQLTGKEYQPSYWYFSGYPDDCMDKTGYTPLKRVDRAIYYYLNALGVGLLCKQAEDGDAQKFLDIADKISKDVLSLMWDEKTNFFYDLHYETNEKAMVKNVVGIYPYWAGITDPAHKKGLATFFSPEFDTQCPFPSVSTDCPVYQYEGSWKGNFFKGRNGCMWNGPTWPYTNSIALDAIAQQSKRSAHAFDDKFKTIFRKFSMLHYQGSDLSKPYLVEHYNSKTGELLSDEVEYNHSYYIDLVIKHVAGLEVEDNRITLDPINMGLDYFDLDNIKIGDKKVRVTYKKRDVEVQLKDLADGYNLYIDNKLELHNDLLTKMVYELSFTD